MNKQEKQIQWIVDQGYQANIDSQVYVIYFDYEGWPQVRNKYAAKSYKNDHILGVLKNKQFIPMPQFEDDKPEPRDKALQEYIKIECVQEFKDMMQELNNRLKALEEKQNET